MMLSAIGRPCFTDSRAADMASASVSDNAPPDGARSHWLTVILVLVSASVTGGQPTVQTPVEVATTVAFLEGPTSDATGNVYFTDIINQRILKLSAAGTLSVFREKSNVASGLLIDPQGRLIACEGAEFERPGVKLRGTPRVTRTNLDTGQVEVLADSYAGKPLVANPRASGRSQPERHSDFPRRPHLVCRRVGTWSDGSPRDPRVRSLRRGDGH